MDIKKYEIFQKVVELKSLTQAAEENGLTQSGVSHIINNIENEFGLKLLKRTRVGAYLTSDGERIYPYIKDINKKQKELNNEIEKIKNIPQGTITIAAFTSVATNWLPKIINNFKKEYKDVKFNLLNGDYHDVEGWFHSKKCDIAFISLPTKINANIIELYEDRLLAILPKGHKLANKKVVDVADLIKEPFISLLENSNNDANKVFETINKKPQNVLNTKDDYAIIAMVREGLGVSIMPELLLKGNDKNIEIRETDPKANRTIAVAIQKENNSIFVKKFVEYIKQLLMK